MSTTVGQPYREFLERAEEEGFDVMEGEERLRAEALHTFKDIEDTERINTDKVSGWFSWVGMDIEEYDEAKKREKEKSVLDALPKSRRVPNKYMPGFWPLLALGIVGSLHTLLVLMQVWRVDFNVYMNYLPVDMTMVEELDDGKYKDAPTHIRVTPAVGKDVLVECEVLEGLGCTFEYHRRHYVWNDEESVWEKIRCRTNMATSLFSRWTGFQNPDKLEQARIRFGENQFNVKQPDFLELYKKQLLSPLCVFQLFSTLLWVLDEYWQYSFFTLFMILMFEGTVVFQKLKSLGALKGMGNKIRDVYVYRSSSWVQTTTDNLLPGDIMSLKKEKKEGGDVIPADVLLLNGSTVVSEASLTGESIPQMKERISEMDSESLAIKGKHKNHVMYAGTTMLQAKSGNASDFDLIPNPPDSGCVCFVLRTGFTSAQGKLVRMIEGSQEKVKGSEVETALLLLLLFFFACASSGYVLKKGMENKDRSKYELLLHCILIITSVIPPELPMQQALAVNNSLMTLMKLQVFCTDPPRVPIAGKIDSCLFDKTGTLTTDELVAVGVFETFGKKKTGDNDGLTGMTKIEGSAGLVLSGCNSLIFIDGEVAGDPLESAALKAMRWEVKGETGKIGPKEKTEKREEGKTFAVNNIKTKELSVLHRHHFSSKLQRMSCIIKDNNGRIFVVVKGSPEAIGERVVGKHGDYDATATTLSKKGLRVIGLGFKEIQAGQVAEFSSKRDLCECDLTFSGFIAFTCRVRKDTKAVLGALRGGGMSVAMVTGDNLLTAAHVAKEVAICTDDQKILILAKGETVGAGMFWKRYSDDSKFGDFVAGEVPDLAKEGYELSTTGKILAEAYECDSGTKDVLWWFKIFARMSPDAKETVIENLQNVDHICLMCGDGANDVGALKAADVGIALLSGFGDLNVDKGEDSNKKKNALPAGGETAMISAQEMDRVKALPVKEIKAKIRALGVDPDRYGITEKADLVKLWRKKSMDAAVVKHDARNSAAEKQMTPRERQIEAKRKQKEAMADKQRRMAERVAELEAKGESWAQFKAMKEFMSAEMEDAKKKKAEISKNRGVANSAARMAASMEDFDMDDGLPTVKIGDASVAAPFTSKMPSIRSCVDIVRQGRCTLVTSVQQYQILALNCLISSYSLSVLYLDGVKYGDTQMTAMGILMSVAFMSVSRSKPLDKLSPVRPLNSIFHPSLFISLLGQFAVHLAVMYIAVGRAKEHLPADYKVELDGEFKPGIVNSVVFLVSNVQQVTVFVVNLKGRPFMHGLTENRPLLYSLAATFILVFMFASETMPGLNKYFQLVPFPTDEFRDWILTLLAGNVILTLFWDRLMQLIFAPRILWASMEGTTIRDVIKLVRTLGVIGGGLYMLLGDDAQWEELMLEEGRFDELGFNGTNATNATNTTEIVEKVIEDMLGKGGEL